MKIEVTIQKIWDDPNLATYFFRKKAYKTFEEVVRAVGGDNSPFAFNVLANTIEDCYESLDDFEEDCYNNSVDEILETLGYDVD